MDIHAHFKQNAFKKLVCIDVGIAVLCRMRVSQQGPGRARDLSNDSDGYGGWGRTDKKNSP